MTRNVWQGASWECWAWHNVCGSSSKQQQQRHQPRSFRPCRCQLSDKRLEATGPHQQPAHTYPATHTHTHIRVCAPDCQRHRHMPHMPHQGLFSPVCDVATKFWRFVAHFGPWCNQRAAALPLLHIPPLPQTHRRTHTHRCRHTHTGAHYTEHIGKSSGAQI